MEACKEAFDKRVKPITPTESAMELVEVVLDSNGAQKHHRQIEGVAIGSKLGRNFACTYMRKRD